MAFKPAPLEPGIDRRKGSDREEVERASAHLLELLGDPHYYEAYVRLRKAQKLPAMPIGSIPVEPGKLAANLAKPASTKIKRGPGAPTKEGKNAFGFIVDHAKNRGVKWIAISRAIVDREYPNASEDQREKIAQDVSQILRDINKARGKKSSSTA